MNLAASIRSIPSSALWLGMAGLVPFWFPVLAALLPHPPLEPQRAVLVQMGYAAIILSFLGGIRWGAALKLPRGPLQFTLFACSVLPALAAYLALLLPALAGLLLLIAGLLVQGVWDVQSSRHGQLPDWFATLRALLSAGALLSLLLALVLLRF